MLRTITRLIANRQKSVKSAIAAVACLAVLLAAFAPLPAAASENKELPDLNRKGSITVTFTYYDETTGKTYPVSNGNSVALFKVADVVSEDGGFKFVPDSRFSSIGEIPETDEELNSANLELAEKLAKIAAPYDYDESPAEMNADGVVSFPDLEVGLYLVLQAKQGTGDNKFTIAPFLVSIPFRNPDGSLIYDVDASTKPIGIAKEKTPPPPPPPSIPQTGQLWWPVPVLGALGVALLVAGIIIKRRN